MRHAFFLISLMLLPELAQSQERERLTLIASDQGSFSRVRVILDGRSYGLEQVGPRQFDLLLPDADVTFDTSQIFPGRRASRITGVREVVDQTGGRVRLSLNCNCRASMSADDGLLTLDFHDPVESTAPDGNFASSTQPPAVPVVPQTSETPVQARPNPPPETPSDTAVASQVPAPGGTEFAPNRSFQPRHAPRRTQGSRQAVAGDGSGLPEITAETAIDRAEIEAAQQRLLKQLTRAAEQGLLEFRDPETAEALALAEPAADPPGSVALQQEAAAEPVSGTPAPGAGPAPQDIAPAEAEPAQRARPQQAPPQQDQPQPDPPVRARTAYDQDFEAARVATGQATPLQAVEPSCIPDGNLAISDWGGSEDPARDIASLRRDLLGEFDRSDPAQVLRLAKLYIHHGLGAEAQQILRLYGAGLTDAPLLTDIARVIDGYPVSPQGPLARAGTCSGAVTMWAGAARLPFPPEDFSEETEAALLDAFAALSPEMRRMLGPPLVLSALDSDRKALAMKLDLLLRRIPGESGPAYDLVRARLLDAEGKVDEAEAIYSTLARGASVESSEALLLLFDSLRRRGAPISQDLTEGLAIAAFMNRHTPFGRKLKIAEFRARAGTDGLPEVLDQIASTIAQSRGNLTDLRDAGHAILEAASAAETGEVDYARAVLAYQNQIAPSAAGDSARIVASSELLGAGLANAALDILGPALRRGGPGVMLAAARAHLAMDAPDAALQALDGLDTAEAAHLRARAFEQAGAPDAALDALSALTDAVSGAELAEERAALSWQAGVWEGAASAGPDQRRILAAYMAGQSAEDALGLPAAPGSEAAAFLAPPQIGREVTMRDARSVMEASKSVRTLIEEALEDG